MRIPSLSILRSNTNNVRGHGAILLNPIQRLDLPCDQHGPKISYFPKRSPATRSKSLIIPRQLVTSTTIIGRLMSTSATSDTVIDEDKFDYMLHERELNMHRHPTGPVRKMETLSKSALKGKQDVRILDLDSQPIDSSIQLAKDLPESSVFFISVDAENVTVIKDEARKKNLSNVTMGHSSSCYLEQFSDSSLNLVVSCYGLQKHSHPKTLLEEIHRVLKPGGTMVVAAWDHLGTEPIVNKMMTRVIKGRNAKVKESLPLTPSRTQPHVLEKMIEDSGLRIISIDRGEYPLSLSKDASPSAAFDLVSLPIKKKLRSLMLSGQRPHAFEDARAAFDEMVAAREIRTDSRGRFVIDDNRYKIIVARREYEDGDNLKDIEKIKSESQSRKNLVPSSPAPLDAVAKFDELLDTSFRSHRYKSFSHFLEAIKDTVKTHETDAFEKLSVLDLGSHPENISPESIFSEAIPEANVYSKGKNPNDRGLNIEVLKPDMPRLTSVEHRSVDMVTCAFGFPYMEDPNAVMSHVHRVLKPGGSLVAASWDSISLEHIANHILSEIIGKPPVNIHFLDLNHPFNGPHYLEKLAEHGGLSIVKSEHFEFPFVLTEDGIVHDDAFDFAILPIRHILKNLEETGSHPNARSEAREIFDQMIEKGELFSIDDHGCLITDANRFNVVVARRLFEDSDGIWTME